MTLCTHLCRGNFKSTWAAQGGYEPVAEALLSEMKVDGYFLEYDDERSGDFRPLRFLPKGKTVVLGLVTTKVGTMESKDALKRRIDEASRYAPLEQLALSPAMRLLEHGPRQRDRDGGAGGEVCGWSWTSRARSGEVEQAGGSPSAKRARGRPPSHGQVPFVQELQRTPLDGAHVRGHAAARLPVALSLPGLPGAVLGAEPEFLLPRRAPGRRR